ncbi:MAG TPA: butyrate kinase [Bacteroidales bacterium]|nr:butyrate kinase [Bacteroidales bacterium]HQB55958.1 butyrate kinase [Bacteroidales bacterium]
MKEHILVINPGSTSTKIAVFEGLKEVFGNTIRHTAEDLAPYPNICRQYEFRKKTIFAALESNQIDSEGFAAVIGRGGLVKPIESGTYRVNELMLKHLSDGIGGEHASNLGGLLAHSVAAEIPGCQAFIADPVVVDELQDVARVTGIPEIERVSIFHALNQKAIAKRHATVTGKSYEDLNLIVAHLGGGISVGAHRKGRVIDVNNALNGDGPIAPERAGTIPALQLAKLCFSGKYTYHQICKMITGKGGMVAHVGTNSFMELYERVQREDSKAIRIYQAMAYTIAKQIGATAVVLNGHIDAILFTGGIAHNKCFIDLIIEQVGFLGPCHTYAGEDEMSALAYNAYCILTGKEKPRIYTG